MTLRPPGPGESKETWRAWAKQMRREGIPEPVSNAVTDAIAAWLPTAPSGLVVLYLPLPDELDITGLLEMQDRSFALTRTPPDGPLTLHAADGPRQRHRFGFEQPTADAPELDPVDVGVVLVPGLVFDRHGRRLGRGAGYFDAFLPRIPAHAPRVAVAPSWLVVDRIPDEPHDVAMTHLATEHGLHRIIEGDG